MKKCLGSVIACLAAAAMIGCGRSPETDAPAADAHVPATPKPSHAVYSLQWISNNVPATMPAGKSMEVQASVKNTGDWPWPDPFAANPDRPNGTYAVRLAYNWVSPDGKIIRADSVRGDLTAPVPPGETAKLKINVVAPAEGGSYQLQLDLVEELVFFFSAKGNEKLTVPVTVQ